VKVGNGAPARALHVGRGGLPRAGVAAAALAVLAAAACCAGANRGSGHADIDLAARYERGDSVPRDFRKAAELLSRSCSDGRGIPSACRRLALARARGRGVPVDRGGERLLSIACKRGDWLACVGPISFDEDTAEAACRAGKHEACLALANLEAGSDSGAQQDERWGYIEAACRAGVLEGCHALAQVGLDSDDTGAAIATARLTEACRRGDADACDSVGKPIAARELCDAGDYRACAAIDDSGTLALACDNNVLESCEHLALRAVDAEPADPHAVEYLARACRLGSIKACEYNRPAEIATGCVAYHAYIIAPEHRRKVPHLHGVDATGRPWTAPTGPLLVLANTGLVLPTAYDEVARHVDIPVVVAADPRTSADPPPLERATPVRLDASFTDEPVVTGAHDLSVYRVARANSIIDRDDVVRAVLWGGPTVPATFARCVRHLLESI